MNLKNLPIINIAYRIAAKSRGKCCLKKTHKLVNDGKDHYPIKNVSQARNALSRVMGHESVPPWFDGTLTQLRRIVKSRVHKEFGSIDVDMSLRKKN